MLPNNITREIQIQQGAENGVYDAVPRDMIHAPQSQSEKQKWSGETEDFEIGISLHPHRHQMTVLGGRV